MARFLPAARTRKSSTGPGMLRLAMALAVFALDLRAITSILGARARTVRKLAWIAVVVIVPLLGFLAWQRYGTPAPPSASTT